jgi:hypothetical protein
MSVQQSGGEWTNPSVLAFAAGEDPMRAATAAARRLVQAAIAEGMSAPPVDPIGLANMLGLELRPHNDVTDANLSAEARTSAIDRNASPSPLAPQLPTGARLTITYNPSRPRGRLRFSIAHEIAHALFPDVHETIRHRTGLGAVAEAGEGDEWELELLCNIIAAELLLPNEAIEGLLDIDTDIDFIMETRRRWDVSTEALLRRLVRSSARDLALVAASRRTDSSAAPPRVEYVEVRETAFDTPQRGDVLPVSSPFGRCTAVGQTARGQIERPGRLYTVQVVGVPGYPGRLYPRVLGLLEPQVTEQSGTLLSFRQGDLLDFESSVPVVLAHVVTDSARAWSRRGVAASLARRYPQAARAFRAWSIASPDNLKLGNVHVVGEQTDDGTQVSIASIVAQQGYGPGSITRLHYDALHEGLAKVAEIAQNLGADLHVPRLGAGQAGGRWDLVERELAETVAATGVKVTVHTLPSQPRRPHAST